MDTLEGRVALVTGGASGIGLAMVKRFAANGMRVVMADIEEAALNTSTPVSVTPTWRFCRFNWTLQTPRVLRQSSKR